MLAYAVILGLLAFLSTVAGSLLAGLSMSLANIATIAFLLTLLGLVFGTAALALVPLQARRCCYLRGHWSDADLLRHQLVPASGRGSG